MKISTPYGGNLKITLGLTGYNQTQASGSPHVPKYGTLYNQPLRGQRLGEKKPRDDTGLDDFVPLQEDLISLYL